MAQKLQEQIDTIERSLGERMIEHALVIVHSWLEELSENNPYEQAFASIRSQYKSLFDNWISSDDELTDARLNELTGDAYQLVDAVYADIRLKRGLSPTMHGFNPTQLNSVVNYFSNCVQMHKEDFDWLRQALNDQNQAGAALMAVGALVKNLRECFNIDAMLALIDGMRAESEFVADQCLAYIYSLLIHYDIRIDFFPQIQKAFVDALAEMGDEGENAFDVLCAFVRSTHPKWSNHSKKEEEDLLNQLPEDVRGMLEEIGEDNPEIGITAWIPKSEQEYMQGLVAILPDTWLYSVLVADNTDREAKLAVTYLSVGRMDLLWDRTDVAERWLLRALREGSNNPQDYINYAHCQLLKGDRIMAFENYKQARQLCQGPKHFFRLFRPDRKPLADHGVPLEQIYLLEDQMLQS